MTLRRCVHAWFGVACRNAPETRARYEKSWLKRAPRLALRAMGPKPRRADPGMVRRRARGAPARARALARVARRAAGAWRALALGRRARAGGKAAAASQPRRARPSTVDCSYESRVGRRFAVRRRDAVPDTLAAAFAETEEDIERARTGESRTGASRTGGRDAPRRGRRRRSGKKTDLSNAASPAPVGSPRLAADAALLERDGTRGDVRRRAHHAEARGHRVGAVSAQSRPAR